jgi:hypothetical protein
MGRIVPTLKVFSLVLSAAHSAAVYAASDEPLSEDPDAQPASTNADEAARARPPSARVRREISRMVLLGDLYESKRAGRTPLYYQTRRELFPETTFPGYNSVTNLREHREISALPCIDALILQQTQYLCVERYFFFFSTAMVLPK